MYVSMYFLVCKGPSNDGVGEAKGTEFQKTRRRFGFKSGDVVKEKLEGLP